ncbi:hypothetical protein [Aquimarina sp. 433]
MKNINKTKILIFSVLFLFFACKQSDSVKKEEVISESIAEEVIIEPVHQNKSKHSLDDFQGIWESYSEYLEHESDFKDYNKHKYYKIISGNEVLDIILVNGSKSNVQIDQYYIGFLDTFNDDFSKNKDEFLNTLQKSGSMLVRSKKGQKTYDKTNIERSIECQRYFDVTEVLDDGFVYDEKDKYVSFRLISSLPIEIFNMLKTTLKKENLDYISGYGIDEKSKKVKITVGKTFFHNEMSETSKRKAFLVKGDIAYMEDVNENWVKVYYDGKIISGGYIKRADVEVLK